MTLVISWRSLTRFPDTSVHKVEGALVMRDNQYVFPYENIL